jgi:hypothetical protein
MRALWAEQALPSQSRTAEAAPRAGDRAVLLWKLLVLGAAVFATAGARVWIIGHYPEPDGDAKGHLGIAAALLTAPFRVGVHWVWPPGYHYFLAALLRLGADAQGVRFLNCALAAVLPVFVWLYAERGAPPSASRLERLAPLIAGVLCAVMPIVNLLGSSAQPGTLFALLVLCTVWSIDRGRFALGGATLAAAVMVRYEAAGAIALLVGLRLVGYWPRLTDRLPRSLAAACHLPLALVVPPVVTIVAWLLAHRVSEGTWLGFIRELYRYTHAQRQTFFHQDAWTDFFFFPVVQPYYLFGLTLPLCLLGIRRACRTGFVVPLGIYLFLVGSYACKGVLASGRYYESLTPFLCIAAAHGACVVGERWRPATLLAYGAALVHVVRLLLQTGRWTFHVAW